MIYGKEKKVFFVFKFMGNIVVLKIRHKEFQQKHSIFSLFL